MQPSDSSLNRLLSVINQLESVDLSKKGLYYDTETNEVKAFDSRWFISALKKRSENNYTSDALHKISDLFDKSMKEVKEALLNPSLSKQERETLLAKAEIIQARFADPSYKTNKALETFRTVAKKRDNEEIAATINELLVKFKSVKQTFKNSLDVISKLNGTFESINEGKTIPSDKLYYNPETEKFARSERKLSQGEMLTSIQTSFAKLQGNLALIQEEIIENLNPFDNPVISVKETPEAILKQLDREKKHIALKDDVEVKQIRADIKQYQKLLKQMENHFIDASPAFLHLLSKLPKNEQDANKSSFLAFSNKLINNYHFWDKILDKFLDFSEPYASPKDSPLMDDKRENEVSATEVEVSATDINEQDLIKWMEAELSKQSVAHDSAPAQEIDEILYPPPQNLPEEDVEIEEILGSEKPSIQRLRDLKKNNSSNSGIIDSELDKWIEDFNKTHNISDDEASDKPTT